MSDVPSPQEQMKQRTQRLAQALLDAMTRNDPDADWVHEAYENEKEERDVAIISDYHATRKIGPPTIPPHPNLSLPNLDTLRQYLATRGFRHEPHPNGLTLLFELARKPLPSIHVEWLADRGQVRFTSPAGLDVPPHRRADLALAIEHRNAQIGHPVWRIDPDLSAIAVTFLDHDGALFTRTFEPPSRFCARPPSATSASFAPPFAAARHSSPAPAPNATST